MAWQDQRSLSSTSGRIQPSYTTPSWTGQAAPQQTPQHPSTYPSTRRRNITHQSLHIRNVSDVLVILEAVRRKLLPLTMRLSGGERDELCSGNVFVWEESTEEGGLVRWTDGRRWSQSRVVGDCLFYQEKIDLTEEEKEAKAQRRVQRTAAPGTAIPPPPRNKRPSKSGGLTKQTYSFHVAPTAAAPSRKWHLVAYSQWTERGRLPVIEDYPTLREVQVPAGVFTTSKRSDSPNPQAANTPPPPFRERHLHRGSHASWRDGGSNAGPSAYAREMTDEDDRDGVRLAPILSQAVPITS
ncbi:Gti1/Pac2 family-domain-containing protein [Mycena amicta]|nr:Gti1/Pac2 family-domain-containing protein [Mycena amicta]